MAANSVDEIVLVVHGVGDPAPGETLSLFARSIADDSWPLTETQEVLWLQEEDHSKRNVHTFCSHVRHLNFASNRMSLAEVYWGDLSRVRKGVLGAIRGLIELVFGLRFVAFAAADQPRPAARAIQWLGLWISRIMHGPMLAINAVMLLLALAAAATELLWQGSSNDPGWSNILVGSCIAVSLLATYVGFYFTASNVMRRFWFWVLGTALLLSFVVLLRCTGGIPPDALGSDQQGVVAYCHVLVTMVGLHWLALVGILAMLLVSRLIAMLDRRLYQPAMTAAVLLPAISLGVWGVFLPFLWIVISEVIGKVIQVREFDLVFEQAIPVLGTQILFVLVTGCMAGLCLAKYSWWRDRYTVTDFTAGRRPPRLIVNASVQLAVLFSMVLGVYLASFMASLGLKSASWEEYQLGVLLAAVNKYAVGPLVPLSLMLLVVLKYLRPALDIVGDVVTHFYFNRQLDEDRDSEYREDAFEFSEMALRPGKLNFVKRDAICARMKKILKHFRDSTAGRPKLSIVAHSQGTIIAIEVLNDADMDWLDDEFGEINLITMGSPFTHIYQYYFRHLYPSLRDLHWSNLRNRVAQWSNIFRIDDFVGTTIEFDSVDAPATLFTNHPVPRYGHLWYWSDRKVLDIIKQKRIGQGLHTPADDTADSKIAAPTVEQTADRTGSAPHRHSDSHLPDPAGDPTRGQSEESGGNQPRRAA